MQQQIPAHARANCEFCHRELNTQSEGVHQYVSGWVMNRSGGGGHGISLAVRANRWAHRQCVDQATRGHIGQASLL